MEQIYIPKHNYKVLVRTITYNQAKYITDTLDGVAMQQTNFPFVHHVIDDCSTDGEQEVIKHWINEHCNMDKAEYIDLELANVILVSHKINLNLTYAIYLLKRNLWKEPKLKETLVKPWREQCKYEAHCEGDDYWGDPKKLQKQVNVLELNHNIQLVYTGFYNVDEHGVEIYRDYLEWYMKEWSKSGDVFASLLEKCFILTCTICFRIDILNSSLFQESPCSLDYLYFLTAAAIGDVHYIPEKTTCYRLNPHGAMQTQTARVMDVAQRIRIYFFEKTLMNETKRLSSQTMKKVKKLVASYIAHSLRRGNYKEFIRFVIISPSLLVYTFSAFYIMINNYARKKS